MTEKTENEVLEEKLAHAKEDANVSEEKYLTFPLNKISLYQSIGGLFFAYFCVINRR